MTYRDDREALHQRVAQLQQQLEDARRDGEEQGRDEAQARADALERKLAGVRSELGKMEAELEALRGGRRRTPKAVALAAAAALVVAGGLAASWTSRSKPSPLRTVEPQEISALPAPPERARPAVPDPMPAPAPAPEREPPSTGSTRSTTARWNAKVSRAEGLPIAPGSSCTIHATIAAADTNAIVRELAIECGGQKLYRSTDALNGMAHMSNDAREELGRDDETSSFTLKYSDIGTRTGARSQVDLDTSSRQGTVFRESTPRFRVDLSMPTSSVLGPPLSGSDQRLRRSGRIIEVSGSAPVKNGATCVLRAMPTGNRAACTAEIACGATVLWPKTAPVRCTYEASRPVTVETDEGPPSFTLEGSTLAVKAKSFNAVVALDER